MIGQTEQIKRDPSGLECDEQMFLNDWTKPTCEISEDEAIDSGRSSVSSTSSCHDVTLNSTMNRNVYDTYTDLSTVNQYSYYSQATTDGDIGSWKDKHPCLWTSQDVIVWLFHLNQDPKLPTKMSNKDLEVTAFSSLTGVDLVQMRCDEYLKCDPANAMFIYLKLQEELNRHQGMKNMEFTAPPLEQESPINYTNTKPTTDNQSFKINSMDLRLLSFDNNEMFSSIRSLKNEPETPHAPPSIAPPSYTAPHQPIQHSPQQHSPQQHSPIQPADTPSPVSPYGHAGTPPYSPPYSPHYSAAGSPPMMCPPPQMAAEQMMQEARFYQYYPQQPIPFMNQQIPGFNMTEIKGNHLWEFVRDLLLDNRYNPSIIRWEDRESGIFRFVRSDRVAKLWGLRKNNPAMTYEKLSRAMRYYYQRKILERIDGKRLVYKFGTAATGWKP